MTGSERLINIIEDHKALEDTLTIIRHVLEDGVNDDLILPTYNDEWASDMVETIVDEIKTLRRENTMLHKALEE